MFYKVQVSMNFTTEDDANDFWNDIVTTWATAKTINPGTPQAEISVATLHHCDHDAEPITSCHLEKEKQTDPD